MFLTIQAAYSFRWTPDQCGKFEPVCVVICDYVSDIGKSSKSPHPRSGEIWMRVGLITPFLVHWGRKSEHSLSPFPYVLLFICCDPLASRTAWRGHSVKMSDLSQMKSYQRLYLVFASFLRDRRMASARVISLLRRSSASDHLVVVCEATAAGSSFPWLE